MGKRNKKSTTHSPKEKSSTILNVIVIILFLCAPLIWALVEGIFTDDTNSSELPALSGRVVDQAEVYSAEEKESLTERIKLFEAATGGQLAVLTIPTLNGREIAEYGIKIAEKWKIGRKDQDNGAILILAIKDRKSRLEIGYQWEAPVNDAKAGDILREMRNPLQKGDYAGATLLAVNRLQEFITHKPATSKQTAQTTAGPENQASPEEEEEFSFLTIIGICLLLGGALFLLVLAYFLGCFFWQLLLFIIARCFGSNMTWKEWFHEKGSPRAVFSSSSSGDSDDDDSYSGGGGSFGGGGSSDSW